MPFLAWVVDPDIAYIRYWGEVFWAIFSRNVGISPICLLSFGGKFENDPVGLCRSLRTKSCSKGPFPWQLQIPNAGKWYKQKMRNKERFASILRFIALVCRFLRLKEMQKSPFVSCNRDLHLSCELTFRTTKPEYSPEVQYPPKAHKTPSAIAHGTPAIPVAKQTSGAPKADSPAHNPAP